jgi:hypothetical protein
MIRFTFLSSLAFAGVLAAQKPPEAAPAERPIDLVICLDISGSMNGLIDAARQNLWAVVNDLALLKPTPSLRVALLTYGCSAHPAEDGWVKLETGFTTDLDTISESLFALTTNGGDEYVGRVLRAAIDQLDWSPDPKALKLLFVAGNEAATQDPTYDSALQSRDAIARGIVVNSIYCGSPQHPDASGWQAVAKLADGKFACIEQDSGIVITTPFDDQLAALSTAINTTYVPYGERHAYWVGNQARQDGNAAKMNSAAVAQRCQTKGGALYDNSHWDLVDACQDPKFELAKVKKEELPEELRVMSAEQLQAHVTAMSNKRAGLQKQIAELGVQRDAHVQQEMQKLGQAGKALFETAVLESVRKQAEARGFERPKAPEAKAEAKTESRSDAKIETDAEAKAEKEAEAKVETKDADEDRRFGLR